jgi:hypothetical protein
MGRIKTVAPEIADARLSMRISAMARAFAQ